jgi:hypothetical protein
MKIKLFLLSVCVFFATACSAQFFSPLPKPGASSKIGAAAVPTVQNNIRPVVGVTALTSDGTQLAGGFGAGWQHNVWDDASQTWNTQYSLSAIGFLGSNLGKATFTSGAVVGVLNFVSIGYGYDFTDKRSVLITGVQLHFN